MKQLRLLAIVLVWAVIIGVFVSQEKNMDVVQLDSGPISGTVEDSVYVFRGIPYAAPPLGELRWKAPQPVTAWTSIKSCTGFGPSCPQPKQKDNEKYDEDCLYLNVWTPAHESSERLPVMVWIHGGAFNFGSGSLPEYDGKKLAEKGVVVVTINYRLGPLGFLAHPLLSQESSDGISGNYGLQDQIKALQWVKTNIAAFGGNPDKVTIFGQSAGSRSVSLLMISPFSAGLFQQAIAQSGGPIIGSEYLNPAFNGDMENALEMGRTLAARLGCDQDEDVLAAMRAKSVQEVVKAADCQTDLFDDSGVFFAPVFDGRVLPANPWAAYSNGLQHDVPIIVGSTLNEGNNYLTGETDLSLAKYQSYLETHFAGEATAAAAVFPVLSDTDVAPALDKIITVGANAQPARFVAMSMETLKSRAYLYQFTRRPDTALARQAGVHHGVDIAYVFGNMREADGYDSVDAALSEQMMNYWVNFARTGNPNGPGLVEWPAYDSQSDINLELCENVHANQHLFQAEADFITRVSPYQKK